MSKRSWREFASAVAAVLIVIGLVTWSGVSNKFDFSKPWAPTTPSAEWFQVGIGIGGLFGLWWTVIFARRAWQEAKRSADEAKRSADAAHEGLADTRKDAAEQTKQFNAQLLKMEEANRIIRENGQAQTRAYISIGTPRAPAVGERIFVFALTNTGVTPARGLHWEYRLRVGQWSLDTHPDRKRTEGEIPGNGVPHEQAILEEQGPKLREAINAGKQGHFHMILRYQDVFGRWFELDERMEMRGRSALPDESLQLTHVISKEREISREEHSQPIRLPKEDK
jgi:hypothetical protein